MSVKSTTKNKVGDDDVPRAHRSMSVHNLKKVDCQFLQFEWGHDQTGSAIA